MFQDYAQLFAHRAPAYERAMRRFPNARDAEFAQIVARAGVQPFDVVADIPAGGGYLRRYLPEEVRYLPHEPCAGFRDPGAPDRMARPSQGLLPLPWIDGEIDVAVSLSGVHHIEDKVPLLKEILRVVRPRGRLVLSDVAEGSAVAEFLDGYVGSHNSTGHEGVFLSGQTQADFEAAGWTVRSDETVDYCWSFDNRADLGAFCHELFDIVHSSAEQTLAAVETLLGVVALPDGRVGMRWSLRTLVAERSQPAASRTR